MDDWPKQLFNAFGSMVQDLSQHMAHDAERWLEEFNDRLAEASDTWLRATDQWAEQVQETLDPELDRFVDELNQTIEPLEVSLNSQVNQIVDQLDGVLEPLVVGLAGLDQWLEEVSAPLNSTVEPILQNYPACVGCRHFYGQAHGGNTLVCAMHPFGPAEESQCPDWESIWPRDRD